MSALVLSSDQAEIDKALRAVEVHREQMGVWDSDEDGESIGSLSAGMLTIKGIHYAREDLDSDSDVGDNSPVRGSKLPLSASAEALSISIQKALERTHSPIESLDKSPLVTPLGEPRRLGDKLSVDDVEHDLATPDWPSEPDRRKQGSAYTDSFRETPTSGKMLTPLQSPRKGASKSPKSSSGKKKKKTTKKKPPPSLSKTAMQSPEEPVSTPVTQKGAVESRWPAASPTDRHRTGSDLAYEKTLPRPPTTTPQMSPETPMNYAASPLSAEGPKSASPMYSLPNTPDVAFVQARSASTPALIDSSLRSAAYQVSPAASEAPSAAGSPVLSLRPSPHARRAERQGDGTAASEPDIDVTVTSHASDRGFVHYVQRETMKELLREDDTVPEEPREVSRSSRPSFSRPMSANSTTVGDKTMSFTMSESHLHDGTDHERESLQSGRRRGSDSESPGKQGSWLSSWWGKVSSVFDKKQKDEKEVIFVKHRLSKDIKAEDVIPLGVPVHSDVRRPSSTITSPVGTNSSLHPGGAKTKLCANGCGVVGHKKCGRCLAVRYCSRECQEAHWPKHEFMCLPQLQTTDEPPLPAHTEFEAATPGTPATPTTPGSPDVNSEASKSSSKKTTKGVRRKKVKKSASDKSVQRVASKPSKSSSETPKKKKKPKASRPITGSSSRHALSSSTSHISVPVMTTKRPHRE